MLNDLRGCPAWSEDCVVTHLPIDVTVKVVLEPSYVADEVADRLKTNVIPLCIADTPTGQPIYQSKLLSHINAVTGVRSARMVRFCRSGREASDGHLRDKIDVEAGECLRLGRLEVEVE
jgi:hypothetical protein